MSLFKTAAKVTVASAAHGRVQRRQQAKWAPQQAAPIAPAPAPVAPAPAPAPVAPPAAAGQSFDDKLAQLKQLGELRDAGILTEAEFDLKKAMILNS